MMAGRALAVREEHDDRRAHQAGEREELPGLQRLGISRGCGVHRPGGRSMDRIEPASPRGGQPADRDQRRAVSDDGDEAGNADHVRKQPRHAVESRSIGAVSTAWLPKSRDERAMIWS